MSSNGSRLRSTTTKSEYSSTSESSPSGNHSRPADFNDDEKVGGSVSLRPNMTGRIARLRSRREPLLDQHYRVNHDSTTGRRVVLPGLPQQDPDGARDLHDLFNLAILVPVVALNMTNWNWDILWNLFWNRLLPSHTRHKQMELAHAWTGEYFDQFLALTVVYFCVDLAWIVAQPRCVKSPVTIIQHHVATLLYLYLPYRLPQCQWFMGACMMVEVNTWFLIARRVFNRQNFPPTVIDLSCMSIRVKVISLFFYLSWISIRCILYPCLLPRVFVLWRQHSELVGNRWNLVAWAIPLHTVFCLLNLKWSYDLLMSKLRYWRRRRKGLNTHDASNKGL